MSENQKTIRQEIKLEGKGIHSGGMVHIVLKPAPAKTGIRFSRTDIDPSEYISASVENVHQDHGRQTSVGTSKWKIRTVEHLMAALHGLQIDNLLIQVDGEELPALDGSSKPYVDALLKSGLEEQGVPREYLNLTIPIFIQGKDYSLALFPSNEFSISYTLSYGHSDLSEQFYATHITPEIFQKEIAPARTFCLKEEAEMLRKSGYGKGADFENTLVFENNKPMNNKLRFTNEACRHKILDLLGDLYLVGQPFKAHVIACRTGHAQNYELVQKLYDLRLTAARSSVTNCNKPITADTVSHCGQAVIKKILPHRDPFLFIDQILEMEPGKKIVGMKKVKPTEFFFQGHFPGHPVMPGVLIIEALAQCGGFLMLSKPENLGKIAYFMTIEKAKFRKPVFPGEELRLEAEVTRDRVRTGECTGRAFVGDNLVCEASVRFAVVDSNANGNPESQQSVKSDL